MDDWKVISTEPYTRLDGSSTALWVWQRPCLKCGAPAFCKSPEAVFNSVRNFGYGGRCDACKDPVAVARGKARAQRWREMNAQETANKQETAQPIERNATCNARKIACNMQHGVQRCNVATCRLPGCCNAAGGGNSSVGIPPTALHGAGADVAGLAIKHAKNSVQVFARSA